MKNTLLSSLVLALCALGSLGAPIEEVTESTTIAGPSPDGGFVSSCSGFRFSGAVMTATCGNGNGGLITDSIDLNQCIANANGQLVASVVHY
jgi:hypothetical protein